VLFPREERGWGMKLNTHICCQVLRRIGAILLQESRESKHAVRKTLPLLLNAEIGSGTSVRMSLMTAMTTVI
jgi:hypothetical protein